MSLLGKINRFLRATKMPETTFGRRAANDPGWYVTCAPGVNRAHHSRPGSRRSFAPSKAVARETDPAMLLMRALDADAQRAGCAVTLTRAESTRWSSATFVGERHALTLEAPDSPEFDSWLGALPEAELPVRSQLVADLAVKQVTREAGLARVAIEALTVSL